MSRTFLVIDTNGTIHQTDNYETALGVARVLRKESILAHFVSGKDVEVHPTRSEFLDVRS